MITKKLGLSRAKRLTTAADFRAVFNQSRRLKSSYFTILARANQIDTVRLGVIIAKRVIKKATRRNAIRRLVKESFRFHQEALVGLDIIVLVRSDFPQQQNNAFVYTCLNKQWQDLMALWKKC